MGVIQINICCHLSERFLPVSAEKFEVEADFEVTLELRTAYMQGVILTTSHRRGKRALALEIHEGQVMHSFYQRSYTRFPLKHYSYTVMKSQIQVRCRYEMATKKDEKYSANKVFGIFWNTDFEPF